MSNQALHAKLVLQFYLWLQRKRNKDNLRKPRILFGDSMKLNYRNLLGKEAFWVLQKRMLRVEPGSLWQAADPATAPEAQCAPGWTQDSGPGRGHWLPCAFSVMSPLCWSRYANRSPKPDEESQFLRWRPNHCESNCLVVSCALRVPKILSARCKALV